VALQEAAGSQPDVTATVEAAGGAASGPAGAADKPKKKKKNKKKKKAQNPSEDYDEMWPSLPKGPHDRAWTINDPPAAWPFDTMSMTRDLVAHLLSPATVEEEADEAEGSGVASQSPTTPNEGRIAVEISLLIATANEALSEDESSTTRAGS
jgi:hypothetical protein